MTDHQYSKRQQEIMHYLTTPGHPERARALVDLSERGAFAWSTDGSAAVDAIVSKYLDENPRWFCAEGIERFKTALGFKPKTTLIRINWENRTEASTQGHQVIHSVIFERPENWQQRSQYSEHLSRLLKENPVLPRNGGRIVGFDILFGGVSRMMAAGDFRWGNRSV